MKRVFDVFFGIIAIFFLWFPCLIIAILVFITSKGPVLYWSDRVGKNNHIFRMPKFRSMRIGTPEVATHLLQDAKRHLTPVGSFLRRTSLDELPQLLSVLKGDMSLVGPRPCLFSQNELIAERAARGVFAVRPGITGLAQIKGIDMSTPELLAQTDAEMIASFSLRHYFRYILLTLLGKGSGDRVVR
mgnify:CR=1 FL=1